MQTERILDLETIRRELRLYNLKEIAEKVGLSNVTLGEIKNGKTNVTTTTLKKVSDFLLREIENGAN